MSNKFPIVEIEWHDSMSFRDSYWHKVVNILNAINETKPIKTIGYLLNCTKYHTLIAQTAYIDGDKYHFGGYFTIPTGAIVSIKYVGQKRNKKNKRQ